MSFTNLLFLIIAFSLFSYFFSSSRAYKKIKEATSKPSALPKHYGQKSLLWTLFPAFLLLIVFTIVAPVFLDDLYLKKISLIDPSLSNAEIRLNLAKLKNVAGGAISSNDTIILDLADQYKNSLSNVSLLRTLSVLLLSAILGIIISSNLSIKKKCSYPSRELS